MAAKGNPFKSLQKEVEKWLELRKKIADSSQEIVNLNNRSSYMTNNKVHNAFGDAMTPSRLSAMLSDEIALPLSIYPRNVDRTPPFEKTPQLATPRTSVESI